MIITLTALVVLIGASFYRYVIMKSKDGLTQDEANDVVLDATAMNYGFSNFSEGQALEKIERIRRKKAEIRQMDDVIMRSAWMKWLDHYEAQAERDRDYYKAQYKIQENRRKAGL